MGERKYFSFCKLSFSLLKYSWNSFQISSGDCFGERFRTVVKVKKEKVSGIVVLAYFWAFSSPWNLIYTHLTGCSWALFFFKGDELKGGMEEHKSPVKYYFFLVLPIFHRYRESITFVLFVTFTIYPNHLGYPPHHFSHFIHLTLQDIGVSWRIMLTILKIILLPSNSCLLGFTPASVMWLKMWLYHTPMTNLMQCIFSLFYFPFSQSRQKFFHCEWVGGGIE